MTYLFTAAAFLLLGIFFFRYFIIRAFVFGYTLGRDRGYYNRQRHTFGRRR